MDLTWNFPKNQIEQSFLWGYSDDIKISSMEKNNKNKIIKFNIYFHKFFTQILFRTFLLQYKKSFCRFYEFSRITCAVFNVDTKYFCRKKDSFFDNSSAYLCGDILETSSESSQNSIEVPAHILRFP